MPKVNDVLGLIEGIDESVERRGFKLDMDEELLYWKCKTKAEEGQQLPDHLWDKLCDLYIKANPCGG